MSQTAVLPSKTSTRYTLGVTLDEQASQEVVANVFEDPSLSNSLKTETLKDFQKLSIEICNIDKDFQAISGKLHNFDAQKFLDVNGNVLPPLQPQWIGHKEVVLSGKVLSLPFVNLTSLVFRNLRSS